MGTSPSTRGSMNENNNALFHSKQNKPHAKSGRFLGRKIWSPTTKKKKKAHTRTTGINKQYPHRSSPPPLGMAGYRSPESRQRQPDVPQGLDLVLVLLAFGAPAIGEVRWPKTASSEQYVLNYALGLLPTGQPWLRLACWPPTVAENNKVATSAQHQRARDPTGPRDPKTVAF